MSDMKPVEIVAFNRAISSDAFCCGKPELDDWLRTKAGQQERSDNTRTFLAIDPERDGVAGDVAGRPGKVDHLGDQRVIPPGVVLRAEAGDQPFHLFGAFDHLTGGVGADPDLAHLH